MAGSGTALSVEQIEQMKQNSPEYQQRQAVQQNEQMLHQKWQSVFNNEQLCNQYVGLMGLAPEKKVIPVPEDPSERRIAQEVAQEVVNNVDIMPGHVQPINVIAAKMFLRACASYTKKRDKVDTKMAKGFAKQGMGVVSQADITPKSNNTVDLKAAGIAAGNNMAYLDKSNYTDGQQALEQMIGQFLNNKIYSTYYLVYYLTAVAGEDPNDIETWGKKRGYQNDSDETIRVNTLRNVSKQYMSYEGSLQHRGEPDKNTAKQRDWIHKNTSTVGGQ